jgi:maltooligosyltrehalose trehalohydrolase
MRRFPIGAEPTSAGVCFRVWAPERRAVEVVLERAHGRQAKFRLDREADGYHSAVVNDAAPGDLYRFLLDGEGPFPDPASRFQPEGPEGPSEIIDPAAYPWRESRWGGVPAGVVIYETHIGTLTQDGTWDAAIERLPFLAGLGITVIELMPVADFPGEFGWGYDGVDLFAPTRLYGRPDDFRRFVDAAHGHGLAVILDVVYNHVGPKGNYLRQFSPWYFTDRYPNEWGEAINFDGDHAAGVREFFRTNARYWIEEFRLDGFRFDATQQIFDSSSTHVLAEISTEVRRAAGGRRLFLVAENEPQEIRVVTPVEQGGFGFDAMWNDDYHHSAVVALTGRHQAYYTDYLGKPQELVSAMKHGFLYQGQHYVWQQKRRGSPALGTDMRRMVHFLENHDQIANSAWGRHLHAETTAGRLRAMKALTLLGRQIPMLFQGEEFASSKPFLYFADHEAELATLVRRGRREFLEQFVSIASDEVREKLSDPSDRATFEQCRIDFTEAAANRHVVDLHRDLLRLRRDDPVLGGEAGSTLDGAVLADETFVLRYITREGDDRLLIVNLGRDFEFSPAPEPLLAPPEGRRWEVLWSSESPEYGGNGTPETVTDDGRWTLPGQSCVVLRAKRR